MSKWNEWKERIKKALARMKYAFVLAGLSLYMAALSIPAAASPASGGGISGSQIGTGLTKLIQDATSFLMVLAPIAMVVMIIYFFIRKGMADEMDQKKWNSRIATAIISCVGAFLASVIVNLATSYFS